MHSKSAFTTLKIILTIDLLIVAIAAPSYLYVDSLVPKSASFEIMDLLIDPDWVQVGEQVQISVKVTNVGEKSGEQMLTLTIDDEPTATETVRLSGKENTTLVFTVSELTLGDHTVKLENLIGRLKVTSETQVRPAELKVTDLGISRVEANIGDPIIVSALATNIGDVAGEFSLDFFVNNEKRETINLLLESGESKSVTFEIVENC